MTIAEFKNKIESKDIGGNMTYLYLKINGCKYGQSYQNATSTLEEMKNRFVSFYYPVAVEDENPF